MALLILFLYTAFSKLFDPREFHDSMLQQPLPEWFRAVLLKTLPWTEIAVGIVLAFPLTRQYGLWTSTVLLTAFTIYIGLGVAHIFPHVPCSCGGVFRHMSWPHHFYFNLGCLVVAITGLTLNRKNKKINLSRGQIQLG